MQPDWDNWLERLYHLRRDKSGPRERPHKPVLLLSIIDLLDRGVLTENAVPLSGELVATFKRYFEVVRKHNDRPTNGMALCPNHHWAMDRYLIAPCPDSARKAGVWRVNVRRLDDRIEGQRELVALADKPVIPPADRQFYPAPESLRWREEHLTTAC